MVWALAADGAASLLPRLPPFVKNKLAHLLVTLIQARSRS